MEEEGVWILITEGLSEAEAILGMMVESEGYSGPNDGLVTLDSGLGQRMLYK